ncbi:DUF2262 domain-containing protein [Reichenbachiella versicolor]|uniref:DUF2262 domain-containing protein n=1 Tax=Reichenbachiella versicolor TaxID=1821036 RepID=UPI000D6DDE06|nr:DUF2262 domain-containing protein [Reichenbachiella versicolor]
MRIRLEDLKQKNLGSSYKTQVVIKGKSIDIDIDPDDLEIGETLEIVNKILAGFEEYEAEAKQVLADNFLETYNDNWREDNEPILTAKEFIQNLTLDGINFLSNTVDIFYTDNDMFDGHSLIAQSLDGEKFDSAMMYG